VSNRLDPVLRDMLCCPACRGELTYKPELDELACAPCGFEYPIVEGIPVLFPVNVKARFQELFGRYWDSEERAKTYDTFVAGQESLTGAHYHRGEVETTLRVLGDLGPCRLLDCGCGNGRFFEHYPPQVLAVGIDASLNLLRICRANGRCERLVCCELEHIPFKDASFDRLVCVRVIQHLKKQREAVVEMSRVCKAGGEATIHCYNEWNSKSLTKHLRQSRWAPVANYPFRLLSKSLSPFSPWGIDYDRYNSVPQLRRWLRGAGMRIAVVRGTGFGFNKWFLDEFMISAWLEKRWPSALRAYLVVSHRLETILGGVWPFS
jgi:ubiquinone/menaquinone biosynthesis C-methylase UbiE/uncharacterized protein YbaR (Trm112 family)